MNITLFTSYYAKLSAQERELLKYYAVNCTELTENEITKLGNRLNFPLDKFFAENRKKHGEAFQIGYRFGKLTYLIAPDFVVYLLIKIKTEGADLSPYLIEPSVVIKSPFEVGGSPLEVGDWLPDILNGGLPDSIPASLLRFLFDGCKHKFKHIGGVNDRRHQQLLTLLDYPQFTPLYNNIPFSDLIEKCESLLSEVLNNLIDPKRLENLCEYLVHSKEHTSRTKSLIQDCIHILRFLRGELSVVEDLSTGTYLNCCVTAYHFHLSGNTNAAIAYYEEALRIKRKESKDPFIEIPIFSYSYALALCQNDNSTQIDKIRKLLNKKEIKRPSGAIPLLIYSFKMGISRDKLVDIVNRMPIYELSSLEVVLLCMIYQYFKLPVNRREWEVLAKSSNDCLTMDTPYQLILLEYLSAMPGTDKECNALSEKFGFQSLISRIKREEEWERILNTLLSHKEKEVVETLQGESRIAYLIGPRSLFVQPIIQKRQKNGKWSSGRHIALSRFASKSLPEMDALDMRVAECVIRHDYYYGGDSYEMDIREALVNLIGHPYVFLEESVGVSVEIVAMNLELTILKTKTGYKLEQNTQNLTDNIQVFVETNTRIKVMNLTNEQLLVLQLLGRVSKFPFAAEEKLLLLLKQIDTLITIHSDLINNDASVRQVMADSRPIVQLIPIGRGIKAELYVKPFATEPPYCKPGVGAKSIVATIEMEKLQARRDFKYEIEAAQKVKDMFQQLVKEEDIGDYVIFDDPYQCLELLYWLNEHVDEVLVEWPEGVRFRITHQVDFNNLKLSLKSKQNWFQMEGDLQIGSETLLSIVELLEGVRTSEGRFIRLKNGDFLALTAHFRKQLLELDALTVEKNGELRLQEFATIGLDRLMAEGLLVKGDSFYDKLRKRIVEADHMQFALPKQLRVDLREYQQEGFLWMARLNEWGGRCLFGRRYGFR